MHKYLYIVMAIFCFQHLIRDRLQDMGIKNWYTTFGHSATSFIPDTPLNNHIGMGVFLVLGCTFSYLAIR
jgi:hypothetical protein